MVRNGRHIGRVILFATVTGSLAGSLAGCVVPASGPSGPPPQYAQPNQPPPYGQPAQPPPYGQPAQPTQPPPYAQPQPQPYNPPAPPAPVGCPQELGADAPDTPDGAPTLAAGTHRGCYGMNDARDTFTLTAPAHAGPVLYKFRIEGAGATPCLKGLDADRANFRGLNSCASNRGAALEAWAVVMGGTSWSLETRDALGDWKRTERPYTLQIEATPIADPGEQDSMERPIPLALGEARQAYLVNAANATELDHDYWVVEIPRNQVKGRSFQVEISDVAAEVQVAVQVFDRTGRRQMSRGAPNPGASLRAEVKIKQPGAYIFHVRNVRGDNKTIGGKGEPAIRFTKPYTIRVTAE